MHAWEIYYDEFRRRAEHVPGQRFERQRAFAEAAHEAYQQTADRLTAEGWDDERTLHLVRGLNQAAKTWIERNAGSWEELSDRLERIAAEAGKSGEDAGAG